MCHVIHLGEQFSCASVMSVLSTVPAAVLQRESAKIGNEIYNVCLEDLLSAASQL